MRIRAAVLHEPGRPLVVEEVELDPPKAREVLVQVAAAGVCHSDLHLVDGELGEGRWPMVLGHEGAGVVEAVGEGVRMSRRATRSPSVSCPSCRRAAAASPGDSTCASRGETGSEEC